MKLSLSNTIRTAALASGLLCAAALIPQAHAAGDDSMSGGSGEDRMYGDAGGDGDAMRIVGQKPRFHGLPHAKTCAICAAW